MKSPEEIVALYRDRQKLRGPQHEQMRDILNLYQGDIAVPLPEMRREERPSVVNLAKQGINQMGMRAASVMPNLIYPPIATGRTEDAERNAAKRRKTNLSWWDEVGMNLKLRQRGRWLFAYAHAPVLVCPDFDSARPNWKPISPINTFPAHQAFFDDMVPTDCIVVTMHSVGYIKKVWGDRAGFVLMDQKDDTLAEVLHFIDADEYHTVVTPKLLKEEVMIGSWANNRSLKAATLDWHANLTGRPWVVIPRTINLEDPISTYQGMVGMYEAQAELDALSKIARRKGVFWEEWLVTDQMGAPEILVRADPYNGTVGVVRGGKLERLSPEVQYSTDTGVDRYERNMRVEAGLPSDMGGESSTNVRTGARANALIQSAVDPVLQETHELFAKSLECENHIAIAIDKAYYSGRTKTVWLGSESFEYDPGKVWETDRHKVDYAMAGADVNQMTIVPLQMVGAGVMSPETAMSLHPWIKDVDKELDRIAVSRIDNAIFTGIEQLLATPGGMPIGDAVKLRQLIKSGKADIAEAFEQVQLAAQQRQATQAEEMSQGMPGMEMPGQGAEQPLAIPAPNDSMGNLRNILFNNRAAMMTTPQEEGVA